MKASLANMQPEESIFNRKMDLQDLNDTITQLEDFFELNSSKKKLMVTPIENLKQPILKYKQTEEVLKNKQTEEVLKNKQTEGVLKNKLQIINQLKVVNDLRTLNEKSVKVNEETVNKFLESASEEPASKKVKFYHQAAPLNRSTWKNLQEMNICNKKHPQQYIKHGNQKILINGAKGGSVECFDLSPRKNKQPSPMKKNSPRPPPKLLPKKFQNDIDEFKPGPLSKKFLLKDSVDTTTAKKKLKYVDLPQIGLQVFPQVGVSVEPISHYLKQSRPPNGFIGSQWANFAASVVQNGETDCDAGHRFSLSFEKGRDKILAKRSSIESLQRPQNSFDTLEYENKNELRNLDKYRAKDKVEDVVKKVLNEILNSVHINQVQDLISHEDPDDVSKIDTDILSEAVNVNKKAMKRKYVYELKKLNINVIDLDSKQTCSNESFCKLGCVCTSIHNRYVLNEHCGLEECMFKCSCELDEGNNDLKLSNSVVVNLQNQFNRNLSKEEKKFHRTVVKSNDRTIVLGARRRGARLPKRLEDCSLLSEREMDLVLKRHAKNMKCSVLATKLPSTMQLEPWCMVHCLYRCFCQGKDVQGIPFGASTQSKNRIIMIDKRKMISRPIGDSNPICLPKNPVVVKSCSLVKYANSSILSMNAKKALPVPMKQNILEINDTNCSSLADAKKSSPVLQKKISVIEDANSSMSSVDSKKLSPVANKNSMLPLDAKKLSPISKKKISVIKNGKCSIDTKKPSPVFKKNISVLKDVNCTTPSSDSKKASPVANKKNSELPNNTKTLAEKETISLITDLNCSDLLVSAESLPQLNKDDTDVSFCSRTTVAFKFIYRSAKKQEIYNVRNRTLKSHDGYRQLENVSDNSIDVTHTNDESMNNSNNGKVLLTIHKKSSEVDSIRQYKVVQKVIPPQLGEFIVIECDRLIPDLLIEKAFFFITMNPPYNQFLTVNKNVIFAKECVNVMNAPKELLFNHPVFVQYIYAKTTINVFLFLDGKNTVWHVKHAKTFSRNVPKSTCNPVIVETVSLSKEVQEQNTLYNATSPSYSIPESEQTSNEVVHINSDLNSNIQSSNEDEHNVRWFVIHIGNDFRKIEIAPKQFCLMYEHILKLLKFAKESNTIIAVPSVSNSNCKFGAYAVPQDTNDTIVLGPYGENENPDINVDRKRGLSGNVVKSWGVWLPKNNLLARRLTRDTFRKKTDESSENMEADLRRKFLNICSETSANGNVPESVAMLNREIRESIIKTFSIANGKKSMNGNLEDFSMPSTSRGTTLQNEDEDDDVILIQNDNDCIYINSDSE